MTDRPTRDPNGRVLDLAKLEPAEARELHDALVEAFDALGDYDTPKFTPSPDGGWVGLQAIQSESVLGEHDGVLDDDLVQTIFGTETKP